MWEEFHRLDIMGIGWDGMGDFTQYHTKEQLKQAVNNLWNDGKNHRNDILSIWQFTREIKPGDIVYAKHGISKILARGVVQGEYEHQKTREEFLNVRGVVWTHVRDLPYPDRLSSYRSTLGDISGNTEVIRLLENGFGITEEKPQPQSYRPYTKDDFLKQVYMDESQYNTLAGLLKRKKNIILQGPPGVGKTYSAARLAYSMMGERDTGRVKTVQFHQSCSYEDFFMGYRPRQNGFVLQEGPFYTFCTDAKNDGDRPYFFLIDEINRGNLSKVFGELLMLIEHDKRGEQHAIQPMYSDEQFFVPDNVYIIGMMNTADRSLALIDHALRRRFAFFDMAPSFYSEGFQARQSAMRSKKLDRLISAVVQLNEEIEKDESLGKGFRIGHSYFCAEELTDDAWLSDVAEYELLPLLREYWFDEPGKEELWAAKLRGALRG